MNRYAIDPSKIMRQLGWEPQETFETGIRKTVSWYLDNMAWIEGGVLKYDAYLGGRSSAFGRPIVCSYPR